MFLFRVNPWQMLLHFLPSVAILMLPLLLLLISVFFRVIPWQMLLLVILTFLNSVANLMPLPPSL